MFLTRATTSATATRLRIVSWQHSSISSRALSTKSPTPLLRIQDAQIFRFGSTQPIFKERLNWTIGSEDETWAIIGDGKGITIDLLLGHLRVSPIQHGSIWPLLTEVNPHKDPTSTVSLASFATRPQVARGGGGFYDFTARYGAVREEDRKTLRESLWETHACLNEEADSSAEERMVALAEKLELGPFLDLPLIALSNGQTRRAHVMKELLKNPEVLILDEPLTGLDLRQRPLLTRVLYEMHIARHPRIILGLRKHDPVPEWITHILVAQHDRIASETRRDLQAQPSQYPTELPKPKSPVVEDLEEKNAQTSPLLELKDVSIQYHERKVLTGINWTVRQGERWHLQGANGSGKTTLLSMIMGDHPQSYQQKHLHLFGRPRRSTSTVQIQQNIGFVSPELFNAFPRRLGPQGLTVRDAIGTGLHSTFSYRPRSSDQDRRITELIDLLGPSAWSDQVPRRETFGEELFASLPFGEQSLVLLLRAIVAKPKLLILDEPFAGMNDRMMDSVKSYLRNELASHQAVIFVTHWEQEVPWQNVRKLQLEDGHAFERL